MEQPQPAALPEDINKHPDAINLYRAAVYLMGALPIVVVVGSIILPFVGHSMPDQAWTLAMGALAPLGGMLIYESRVRNA